MFTSIPTPQPHPAELWRAVPEHPFYPETPCTIQVMDEAASDTAIRTAMEMNPVSITQDQAISLGFPFDLQLA
jgi:hypothetical protein